MNDILKSCPFCGRKVAPVIMADSYSNSVWVQLGCDNCKYYNVKPTEEPCFDCVTDDIDRWEGI